MTTWTLGDVERLALYIHQARTRNDEPVYDMGEARRRAEIIVARLLSENALGEQREPPGEPR